MGKGNAGQFFLAMRALSGGAHDTKAQETPPLAKGTLAKFSGGSLPPKRDIATPPLDGIGTNPGH